MAFPTNPTNGQIYGRFKFNLARGAWDKAGDIVDSGSNTNGNYIKYADGTLEQWGFWIANAANGFLATSTSAWSGTTSGTTYFRYSDKVYPVAFVAVPAHTNNTDGATALVNGLTPSTYRPHVINGGTDYDARYQWHAIGRWK